MAKLYAKDKERIAKVKQYEVGAKFLRRKCKKTSTARLYVRGALLFSNFLRKNIDEIVNEYEKDADENLYRAYDKWEMIFEDFGDYLKEKHPKGTSASSYFAGAVALINANVPQSAEIHPKGPEAHPRSIPPITVEDLRTIRDIVNEREGAFIDVIKDTGMSRSDVITLTYGQVKKAVENPNIQYHKINVYRGKENVEYETWLGPNAIESLRLMFKVRRQSGEQITDDTPIFAVKNRKRVDAMAPQSLSFLFRRLSKKTGIKISPHRIRKFFETYITAGGAHPIVAKYWMGHKIRGGRSDIEAAYIIPPANVQRETYMKAYNKIDLRPQPDQLQMFVAETKARMQGMNPEERKRFIKQLAFRHKRLVDHPDIKALLEEAGGPADGGLPAQPAFKEIEEKELLAHLNSGWQIVHNLQNGRVIVKR